MPWRREPYEIASWVSRLGTSSAVIETEIIGEGTVHARASAVLVGFDLETQRSRPYTDVERAAFESLSRPGSP